jgi:hypothetical protein
MFTMIKDCLTGIDGVTYDPARIYLFLAFLSFLTLEIYSVIKGKSFDAQNFGIGFGALLAAGGFGISVKSKTEPGQ